MEDNTIKKILVELDCLLDTRIATVALIESAAASAMIDNNYQNREIDDYYQLTNGLVTTEQFKQRYYDRDVDTLKGSLPTNMVKYLRSISINLSKQKIADPEVEGLTVYVNVNPYQLTEEEKQQLSLVVGHYLYPETVVKIIDLKMSSLTPSKIKHDWDAVILYDFNHWFSENVTTLDTVAIPRNIMYAPALYLDHVPSKEELTNEEGVVVNAFHLMEASVASKLALEFLNPALFSLMELK